MNKIQYHTLTVLICYALLGPQQSTAWIKQKIIIDTDAGVDDAFAIAMLTKAESFNEVEILAITTVSGNTGVHNVSLNVLKVLDTAGRLDIPVYLGSEYALELTPKYDYYFGYDGFGDFDYPNAPNASYIRFGHGVVALVEYANLFPGEIILVCLGPMINYALATRLDPTFPSHLKNVIAIGGSVAGMGNIKPNVEFNYYFDPLAAFIFHNTTKNVVPTLVPWEAALLSKVPLDWRTDVLGQVPGPMMAMLNKAEAQHLATLTDTWICGDGLTAAIFINPDIVLSAETQHMSVEVHANSLSGACIVDYNKVLNLNANTLIVKTIDVVAYQSLLLQYLS